MPPRVRRQRHVLPEPAVAVVLTVDEDGRKQERDRRRRQGVARADVGADVGDGGVARQERRAPVSTIEEHGGPAAGDLRRRHGEPVQPSGADVLGDARKVDRAGDDALQAGRVEDAALAGGGSAAHDAAEQAQDFAGVEADHVTDAELGPLLDDAVGGMVGIVGGGGQAAGIDGPDRRAAQDVQRRRSAELTPQVIEDVLDDADLVGATGRSAGQHERHAGWDR